MRCSLGREGRSTDGTRSLLVEKKTRESLVLHDGSAPPGLPRGIILRHNKNGGRERGVQDVRSRREGLGWGYKAIAMKLVVRDGGLAEEQLDWECWNNLCSGMVHVQS
jgi:hypothetical protein